MITDSERELLATLMQRPGDCWGVHVDPEHFETEAHGEIFRRIRDLTTDSQPCDAVSVADSFEREGKRALGVLAVRIVADSVTTSQPKVFADRVRMAWRLRKTRGIAMDLANATQDADIDAAVERLMALHTIESRHEWTAKDAVQTTVAELQAINDGTAPKPAPTGLTELDRLIGGFHRGDLVVIGARPSMGKTSMALGMARAAAKAGVHVGLISGEQPVQQVSSRLLSLTSNIPATQFRTGFESEDWNRVSGAMVSTANLPLWIFDRGAPTIVECVRVARRWKQRHDVAALFVDYLQRVEGEGERKLDQVGNVIRGFKNLARDLDIPVIVLAQVSRQVEQRKPAIPRMGDLSDSSEIEKEADQVLMLYRDEVYNPETQQRGIARIIVEKNRHGPTGFIECAFHAETMRFSDLARTDPIWGDCA